MRSILGHIAITVFSALFVVARTHAEVVFADISDPAGALRRCGGRRVP